MYNKADVVNFGEKFGELGKAMLDGVGMEDLGEFIEAAQAAVPAVNEIQEKPAAAVLHIVHGLSGVMGDHFEVQEPSGE